MSLPIQFDDAIRHNPLSREIAGWSNWLKATVGQSPGSAAAHRCRALDLAESDLLEDLARRSLKPNLNDPTLWRSVVTRLPRYRRLIPSSPALTRSIVLKAPGDGGEKGVLLLYFEYNWARVLLGLPPNELRWLDDRYHLVLSASWSPTDYATLALACASMSGPLFVQPANFAEAPKIAAFHPRLRVLESLACDWVNPEYYQPKPFAERRTDLIMIANWGAFKRHWEFFEALAKMPSSLRVVLIGQKEGGRTMETIRALAADHRVPQNLELHESLTIAQVTAMQCDAKVSVLMSRREGGCVAAVESLFAGCALAMREDAHVGSRAHINAQTGAVLRPGRIAGDLMQLLERAPRLNPRQWAIDHISCHRTTEKMNAVLKAHAVTEGRPWTHDLALANWRPHPTFARAEEQEAMRPAYEELHRLFPAVFPADLWKESWR